MNREGGRREESSGHKKASAGIEQSVQGQKIRCSAAAGNYRCICAMKSITILSRSIHISRSCQIEMWAFYLKKLLHCIEVGGRWRQPFFLPLSSFLFLLPSFSSFFFFPSSFFLLLLLLFFFKKNFVFAKHNFNRFYGKKILKKLFCYQNFSTNQKKKKCTKHHISDIFRIIFYKS